MSTKNRIASDRVYFLTSTVIDWVDIFTRPAHKHIIISSLKHCQEKKGLELYAWCLMSNHIHIIASAANGYNLSDIIRDFKKFTSKALIKSIEQENESRRDWMLDRFEFAGRYNNKIKNFTVWQSGNDAKEIITSDFLLQKINYIHQNPVKAEIVKEVQHYLYSSAINYAGGKGLLDVILAY